MTTTLEKVRAGQTFQPKATTWNAFVDAAQYVRARTLNVGGQSGPLPPGVVRVRNDSAVAAARFALLWLTGAAIDDVMIVERPGHPYLVNLVVAVEPIAAGDIGLAWHDNARHPVRVEDWAALTNAHFPFMAISQRDSFVARRHFGEGNINVLAKHADSPLVYARIER